MSGEHRVAVTGGRGFIGGQLARRLAAAGARVLTVDSDAGPRHGPVGEDEFVHADVRDAAAMAEVLGQFRPRTVYHLAAMHYIPHCEREPGLCVDVNVKGTHAVLRACAAAGGPRVVMASSAAVYAPSRQPHRPDSALGPIDTYGHTKALGEHLVRSYAAETGGSVRIARLFNVVGPEDRNPHVLPSLVAQALNRDTVVAGELATARDYVHVDDVCTALIRMDELRTGDSVATVNVGTGVATTGSALLDHVRAATGKALPVHRDERRVRRNDRPVLVSDCGPTRQLLGWAPTRNLAEAVQDALRRPGLSGPTGHEPPY